MKKNERSDIFGQGKHNKLLKVRCPFCKHTFTPETIQIIGIREEQANFVILICPNARCRTILEIIPQYSVGTTKPNDK